MKKSILGFAFVGFFAAVIGTSFAGPAAQPVADAYASYAGETTTAAADQVDYVVHLEYSDYVLHLEWRDIEAGTPSLNVAADSLFDK
ncbi:MAG: hypothetical protein R3B48_12495 [Kofleriaceae bacterium]